MSDNFRGSLFWNGTLLELMQSQVGSLCAEIDGYSRDAVLNGDVDATAQLLATKYGLDPVKLHRDQTHIAEHGQTTIPDGKRGCLIAYDPCLSRQSAATFYRFVIPFTGDGRVLMRKPSEFEVELPWGEIVGNELHVMCKATSRAGAFIRSLVDDNLSRVARWLHWANTDVVPFNARLKSVAVERLQGRKNKLAQDNALVEALGFPIKTRLDAPKTYDVPVHRKKLPVILPSSGGQPVEPDPHLDLAAYDGILHMIASMGRVFELSPKAFAKMGEEALRFLLLVPLNIHYEGQATGETFNWDGKTDIIVKVGGRNIFIAECLVWDGPDYFKSKIDQLLGYTSWRDTKTAIVVFNRNKNLSGVLAQIPGLVRAHPNCKQEVTAYKHETRFRFVLHHRDDKSRDLTLTVLVFDVPA